MERTPSGRCPVVLWITAVVCLVGLGAAHTTAQSPSSSSAGFAAGWQRGTPASVTGVLTTVVGDDFANSRSELVHLIRDERTGRSFEVRFEGAPPADLRSGARATVRGRADESTIYVAASGGDGMTIQATTTVAGTATDHRTIVIIANFRDAAVTCTPQAITDMMFTDPNGWSVAALYRECSLGQVLLSGDVVGPYTIDAASTDPCNFNVWSASADALATAGGVDLSTYQHKVYVFPAGQCVAAGYSTVGGNPSSSWIFQCDIRGLYAHEMGHGLTLDHASTPTSEYDDLTDPMAMSSGALPGVNAPHRHQLGWYSSSAVRLVEQDGSYDVAPLAQDPATAVAPQILMIRKPDTGEFYYLSYRLPIGFDRSIDGSFYYRLSVHRYRGDGTSSRTFRLAGLADGERFVDQTNDITVTMVSHDATRATATVSFACASAASSLAIAPTSLSGAAGSTQTYAVSLSNNDAPACPASTFALTSAAPSGWTASLSPASVSIAAGSSAQATLTVTPAASAAAASYTVSASAADAATAAHAVSASAAFTVTAPVDTVAPTVPSPVSASVSGNQKQKQVGLSWGRSTDNVGVRGYRIWRDGVVVASTPFTTYSDGAVVSGQTYSYAIEAYDAAGNRSPLSVTATATLSGKRR
jgi:M6 family metalloprotease-like protein